MKHDTGRSGAAWLAAAAMVAMVGATVHGADDLVVDADAMRPNQPNAGQQVISLDDQMPGAFFGQFGGNEQEARRQLLARTRLRISALEAACGLGDRQRQKLETAVRLDLERVFDEIEAVRARYAGRTIDLQKPENHPEWHRFHQDAQALQAKLLGGADDGKLLAKVIVGALDDGQLARWRSESEARDHFLWQAVIDDGMALFDVQLGLTDAQHDALRSLLADKPPRINPQAFPQHGGQATQFICGYALSRVDQRQLKAAVNERQWKALAATIEQGKGFATHLKQQKVILE